LLLKKVIRSRQHEVYTEQINKKHCPQMMTNESSSWMEFIHVLMDIIWQGLEPQSKPAWALQQNVMMPWPALQLSQHRY